MTVTGSQIFAEHNADRRAHGLVQFTRSSGLDASAQIVAHRLARRDQGIGHARFWWRVIDKATRSRYRALGENLALDYGSAVSLMAAWIASVLHRRNIRNPKFRFIGIGIAAGRRSGKPYYCIHFGGK